MATGVPDSLGFPAALRVRTRVARLLLGVLIGSCVAGCGDYEAAKINEARGNEIVQALEEYNRVNGSYPETLDALTPRFLPSLPKARSAQWHYETKKDRRHFLLGFTDGGDYDPVGWYDSEQPFWAVDTK